MPCFARLVRRIFALAEVSHVCVEGGAPDGLPPLSEVVPDVQALDGWGRPIAYWSDGTRYVLVSGGKDGETERDWRHPEDGAGGPRPALEADIVLADGKLVAWPGEPE